MAKVARYTKTPNMDCKKEHCWSGYFGGWDSVKDAIETISDWEKEIEEYEERGEEPDIDEIAEKYSLRYDERCGQWRTWHHSGLSCWKLESESDFGAILEASLKAEKEIAWGGFGYRTIGKVELVAKVPGVDNLYIFECDDTDTEI